MLNEYSEDALIEQPAIELLTELGWQTANLFKETFGADGTEGRANDREVILQSRLRRKLEEFNPNLPATAYDAAIEELTRNRAAMIPVNANAEFYRLLKDGVKVTVKQPDGSHSFETLRVIDWNAPERNDFFLTSQMWIRGDLYLRRTDLVGFVNGLPLLFIELKATHRNLFAAYNDNLRDYRTAIPQLFIPNALLVLSNGSETRLGTVTSEWEHFFDWKRINNEGERGMISLETVLRGVCEPRRFLDLVENFTVFEEVRGGLAKKVAKNHQFLGVNKAIEAVQAMRENAGKLGVFWHTQGSGKSLSMVFFTQKVLRKLAGNWTFVVVTDRDDLDNQIYKTFAATGATTESEAHAASGAHLKQLLQQNHRYVFTLIQKFRTDAGKQYEELSPRSDIIVITDEAHRSQYDKLALNMRNALPSAAFIGFTGTPLIQGEEQRTKEVFGDYVSIYNFQRSIEDRATVPLYYENRIPELQLTNEQLGEEITRVLEDAETDEEQEKVLERKFSQFYQVITRDDRLETVAKDLVEHFTGRGYKGKAMMVCVDKATAVKMYDKVQKYWGEKLNTLRQQFALADDKQRLALESQISDMETTDMAVVVSQSANEIEDLQKKGVEIEPHRRRTVTEDLDETFKDPDSRLRLVFVCAMWITGFDVPTCSTIYLDKPMRNHTLMQTIARANRVAPGKVAGLIVDYVGVFRDLQKALSIYAMPSSGGETGDIVKDKQALTAELQILIAEIQTFCAEHGVSLLDIRQAQKFERVKQLDDAVELLIADTQTKKRFLQQAAAAIRIFKAVLPDAIANGTAPDLSVISVLSQKIRALSPPRDVSAVLQQVEDLLDESISTAGYIIKPTKQDLTESGLVDLSQIDFDALQEKFKHSLHKRTQAELLRGQITRKLQQLVRLNKSRLDYMAKFQEMIDDYNAGSKNIETFFAEIVDFAQSLNEEEKRHIAAGLSEEELAIFDILTKPALSLTKTEEAQVKKVAQELLRKLKWEKLVLDWRSKQEARAGVQETIAEVFDELPETYDQDLYHQKCELAYQHIYASYFEPERSVYHHSF